MNLPVKTNIETIREKIRRVNKLISNVQKDISKYKNDIDECMKNLEVEIPIWSKFKKLEFDVDVLRIEAGTQFSDNDEEEINLEDEIPENLQEECKNLYRKISKECHPDMTDEGYKIDMFKDASEACKSGDYKTLLDIYSRLNSGSNEDGEELKVKLQTLEEDLEGKKRDLENLRKSNSYIITNLYNSDDILSVSQAQKIFTDIFFSKIKQLSKEKKELEKYVR
jgi:hypothetical protein